MGAKNRCLQAIIMYPLSQAAHIKFFSSFLINQSLNPSKPFNRTSCSSLNSIHHQGQSEETAQILTRSVGTFPLMVVPQYSLLILPFLYNQSLWFRWDGPSSTPKDVGTDPRSRQSTDSFPILSLWWQVSSIRGNGGMDVCWNHWYLSSLGWLIARTSS